VPPDNNTTYTAGTGLSLSGTVFSAAAAALADHKSATFIVGNADRGHTTAICDYLVSSGSTTAETQINQAITALPSTGGKVIILEGTYTCSSAILVSKAYTTIAGMGSSTILKRGWNGSSVNGIVTVSSNYCRVESLCFEGVKATYVYAGNCGIYINGGAYCTIMGNTCLNGGRGIFHYASSSGIITGNICISNNYGIYLNSSGNNTVTGNTCNSNNYGIYISSSSNNTITGNTVYGEYTSTSTAAIPYSIYLDNCTYNLILGNNMMGSTAGIGKQIFYNGSAIGSCTTTIMTIGTGNTVGLNKSAV
jgi:parallel beta-helix repeat protein